MGANIVVAGEKQLLKKMNAKFLSKTVLQKKSRKKQAERLEEAFLIICHLSRNSKRCDLMGLIGRRALSRGIGSTKMQRQRVSSLVGKIASGTRIRANKGRQVQAADRGTNHVWPRGHFETYWLFYSE